MEVSKLKAAQAQQLQIAAPAATIEKMAEDLTKEDQLDVPDIGDIGVAEEEAQPDAEPEVELDLNEALAGINTKASAESEAADTAWGTAPNSSVLQAAAKTKSAASAPSFAGAFASPAPATKVTVTMPLGKEKHVIGGNKNDGSNLSEDDDDEPVPVPATVGTVPMPLGKERHLVESKKNANEDDDDDDEPLAATAEAKKVLNKVSEVGDERWAGFFDPADEATPAPVTAKRTAEAPAESKAPKKKQKK
jgi:hypothetical protein